LPKISVSIGKLILGVTELSVIDLGKKQFTELRVISKSILLPNNFSIYCLVRKIEN